MELPSPAPSRCDPALTFALQALLARHEAYMASAERDRVELNARIEQLELDKAALQEDNVRTVEENRALLNQLELLNGTVSESETKIRSLEAALRSTQLTVNMLEGATARAAEMERHIAVLEAEQETTQNALVQSEEEARSALYRWRMADRDIKDMQDQLERIEKEARKERERHVEAIDRMERQRAMDKDLNTAAGRLKGAAAAKTFTDGKPGSSVVSHFVRDLLQDNANLQLSMAELREMLMNSNDEIQMLRDQLLYHQPVEGDVSAASTLRAELGSPEKIVNKRISQELHIHHHYHVATKPESRKPLKKKRLGLTPGVYTPPALSSPSTPTMGPWQLSSASPAPALLSHSAKASNATAPNLPGRWSLSSEEPSDFTLSSVPSSPQTNPRNSMFDQSFVDLSLPTSPTTSVDPMSPSWRTSQRKQAEMTRGFPMPTIPIATPPELNASESSYHTGLVESRPSLRTVQEELETTHPDIPDTADDVDITTTTDTTTNESGLGISVGDAPRGGDTSFGSSKLPNMDVDQFNPNITQFARTLRRVASHESIMSLSNGMDIHTLKTRPSQLALRPLGVATAGTGISTVTALPTIALTSTEGKRSSALLRDNFGLPVSGTRQTGRIVSGPLADAGTRQTSPASRGALGRLASWRIWRGSSPSTEEPHGQEEPSTHKQSELGPSLVSDAQSIASASSSTTSKPSTTPTTKEKELSRAPGINQAGAIPIPGWHEYWAAHQRRAAPSKVRPDVVDREALREVLEGE
jgi:hypothetical protein